MVGGTGGAHAPHIFGEKGTKFPMNFASFCDPLVSCTPYIIPAPCSRLDLPRILKCLLFLACRKKTHIDNIGKTTVFPLCS